MGCGVGQRGLAGAQQPREADPAQNQLYRTSMRNPIPPYWGDSKCSKSPVGHFRPQSFTWGAKLHEMLKSLCARVAPK